MPTMKIFQRQFFEVVIIIISTMIIVIIIRHMLILVVSCTTHSCETAPPSGVAAPLASFAAVEKREQGSGTLFSQDL